MTSDLGLGRQPPLLGLELQPPPHEGTEVRRGAGPGTQRDVGHIGGVDADGDLLVIVSRVPGPRHRA